MLQALASKETPNSSFMGAVGHVVLPFTTVKPQELKNSTFNMSLTGPLFTAEGYFLSVISFFVSLR